MKPATLAATFALVLLGASCIPSDCEKICTDYNTCAVTQRSLDVDCSEFCRNASDFDRRAAVGGQPSCDALFQQHIACWVQNYSSICISTATVCDQSAKAWQDCTLSYCRAIPTGSSDPLCQGGAGYESLSLLSPFQSGR